VPAETMFRLEVDAAFMPSPGTTQHGVRLRGFLRGVASDRAATVRERFLARYCPLRYGRGSEKRLFKHALSVAGQDSAFASPALANAPDEPDRSRSSEP